MTPLVVVCGLGMGAGLFGSTWAWWGDRGPGRAVSDRSSGFARLHSALTSRRDWPLLVAAVVGGAVSAVLTGWPVALPLAAAAIFGVPRLFGQTSASGAISRIEAVATWTEMLQGTLAASAGLSQAIITTAPLAPEPIRPATTRLADRLGAGMQSRDAFLEFADELADPSADRVVCALLLAAGARAQRLGDLMTSLADSTRDEVALRLRIETSRSSVRSGVRTVLVFSVAFALALVVVARSYLTPFGTPQGQAMLAVVGVLYAVGLTLMVSLARPPSPVRLLGTQVVAT
jgi:Flp pilus assembly protein TadB